MFLQTDEGNIVFFEYLRKGSYKNRFGQRSDGSITFTMRPNGEIVANRPPRGKPKGILALVQRPNGEHSISYSLCNFSAGDKLTLSEGLAQCIRNIDNELPNSINPKHLTAFENRVNTYLKRSN